MKAIVETFLSGPITVNVLSKSDNNNFIVQSITDNKTYPKDYIWEVPQYLLWSSYKYVGFNVLYEGKPNLNNFI